MPLGELRAAPHAGDRAQPLDDTGRRGDEPHRQQDQARNDQQDGGKSHQQRHDDREPDDGKKSLQADLERLAQVDRPAAHVLERPVEHDRLAQRVEHDRQQDRPTISERAWSGPDWCSSVEALQQRAAAALAIAVTMKNGRKFRDNTEVVRLSTRPTRKSLSAKRAEKMYLSWLAPLIWPIRVGRVAPIAAPGSTSANAYHRTIDCRGRGIRRTARDCPRRHRAGMHSDPLKSLIDIGAVLVPHCLCQRPVYAAPRGRGPHRGSRLPVLRRRLRGLRGEGRPHDRRAPPHGAPASARSTSCASRVPMSPAALGVVMRETVRRNRVRDGIVYLQVTRGVARRDHAFPPPGTLPSVVVTARSSTPPATSGGGRRRRGHHRSRQPLGARRHQDDLAAAQRARQAGGPRAGRQGSLVRGPGRPGHRRLIEQCLDRHHGRKGGDPAGR